MTTRRSLTPDFITLQAFECAARHQNFSRAAEELNLTQSAVSRQIADLEHQTGVKLFERVRKRVILSEAGERLLPEVKQLLAQAERLMIGAVATGQMTKSLRIATLPTFATKWLVPRLGHFLDQHADVAISLESRSSPFSFAEENFDLAIHFGQPTWANATSTFLCHETVLPVASPLLVGRMREGETGLYDRLPLLHLTTRPKLWSDWARHHGVDLPQAFQGARFDQFSMVISAAAAGLGFALLPTYLIESELKSGTLAPMANLPMQTENAYFIVRPENKTAQIAARDFEAWLLTQVTPSA
ncbi:LysR family transcriptional regulator [Allorhizobium sp. BGMRC 0089]|uniref:LysR family transcriptional regulator n=1 Tax=Allorhizobium sonneratiae TaxID=2934936 RepID=UPI002033F89E|nr:LysR family transcriptional regulator [Allorhizobium sonneratiae]MCM2293999.1 LysR family transcriptional regulator [Allorhizobium sonneratiae]